MFAVRLCIPGLDIPLFPRSQWNIHPRDSVTLSETIKWALLTALFGFISNVYTDPKQPNLQYYGLVREMVEKSWRFIAFSSLL